MKKLDELLLNKNETYNFGYFEALNNGVFSKEMYYEITKKFFEMNDLIMDDLPKELVDLFALYVMFAVDTVAYGQVNPEEFDMEEIYPTICGLIGSTKAE